MPEHAVAVDRVLVAAAHPAAGEVARGFEVGHDGLDGSLGKTDDGADIADARPGIPGDLDEDMPVPGQQRPAPGLLVRLAHEPIIYSREQMREIKFPYLLTGLRLARILGVRSSQQHTPSR